MRKCRKREEKWVKKEMRLMRQRGQGENKGKGRNARKCRKRFVVCKLCTLRVVDIVSFFITKKTFKIVGECIFLCLLSIKKKEKEKKKRGKGGNAVKGRNAGTEKCSKGRKCVKCN